VAKEAADIVLLEKSLAVLEDGIMEGRHVFCNIVNTSAWAQVKFWEHVQRCRRRIFLRSYLWRRSRFFLTTCSMIFSIGNSIRHRGQKLLEKPRRWNIENIKSS